MKLRVDSSIITVGTRITDLLLVNLFWWIGCLPVVTIGASTIAAYTVTLKMTEDREPTGIARAFWTAWVQNLKHGIALTLLFAAVCYSVWMDWQIFEQIEGNPIGFLFLGLLLILLLLAHTLYVFPLEARYENGLWKHLHNARRIFSRFFLRSLSLIGILVIQVLLFTQVAPVLTYIGFFCGPVLMFYTVSKIVMPVFRQLEADSKASDGFKIGQDERQGFSGI